MILSEISSEKEQKPEPTLGVWARKGYSLRGFDLSFTEKGHVKWLLRERAEGRGASEPINNYSVRRDDVGPNEGGSNPCSTQARFNSLQQYSPVIHNLANNVNFRF